MKEILYISGFLKGTDRGKGIFLKINEISTRYNFDLFEIPAPLHAKNEWCRDYMPVKGANGINVLFKYTPSYLMGADSLEKTIPKQPQVCDALNIQYKQSQVIMDGGAIEVFGNKAIISDRVLQENTSAWKNGHPLIFEKIKEELCLNEIIVVPEYPYDDYGHVDGMVRFIDENQVLVNDPTLEDELMAGESEYDQNRYKTWKENFYASLANVGIRTIPLLCIPDGEGETAKGVYMNFLRLKNCIIMPVFNDPKNDAKAKSQLEQVFNLPVETVEASKLAEKGGLINCVTWNQE